MVSPHNMKVGAQRTHGLRVSNLCGRVEGGGGNGGAKKSVMNRDNTFARAPTQISQEGVVPFSASQCLGRLGEPVSLNRSGTTN